MRIADITLTPLRTHNNLRRVQTGADIEEWAEVPGSNRILPKREAVFGACLVDAIRKPSIFGEVTTAGGVR